MCIAPGLLADGKTIACRKCWQCLENRVNDWVGRGIAESKTAVQSHAVTLTYGRDDEGNEDHPRAKVLTYSDVQKLMKRLKWHGFPCRYLAVGEYGAEKSRSHWHVVVYWIDKVPEVETQKLFAFEHWPHGHTFWDEVTPNSVRYNLKYISKDIGVAERQGHLAMSKKPPLGTAYFMQLAERMVAERLAPRDLEYTFDEARNKKGDKIKFWLRGKTADLYLQHFINTWGRVYPGEHLPNSTFLEEWQDKQVRLERGFISLEEKELGPTLARPKVRDLYTWMRPGLEWDPVRQAWVAEAQNGVLWYWMRKPEGGIGWQKEAKKAA